jgi:superfamily I DNA/RNA helicase
VESIEIYVSMNLKLEVVIVNEYISKLVGELSDNGIVPDIKEEKASSNVSDFELDIIENMERINRVPFSDEQRKILTHKGSACILACAGSGKTTVSVNLIAKRIATGELNPDRLLYTTYSKTGAAEMKERLDSLLKKLNIKKKVQVRTLHSFFLSILRTFGVTHDIIKEGSRSKFIREACKDADFVLKEDDLLQVDTLLSYQVNNMLSDKQTVDSYVNTLEGLTCDKYKAIRCGYASRKNKERLIDYDDMQSYLYAWFVKLASSERPEDRETSKQAKNYCRALYDDFFIDEAQDVSKIQYEIIKAIVTNPDDENKLDKTLVFIGDDDQCLVEGTQVLCESGFKKIEDISENDMVVTGFGHGKTGLAPVEHVTSKNVSTDIIKITTSTGYILRGTDNHIGFARAEESTNNEGTSVKIIEQVFGNDAVNSKGIHKCSVRVDNGNECISESLYVTGQADATSNISKELLGVYKSRGCNVEIIKEAAVTDSSTNYKFTELKDMKVGMSIPVYDSGRIIDDTIVNIEKEEYTGKVYDISVPDTRNFIANCVVVHNCIYQWRGSDPSIILSIGPKFNIDTFVLSTNYRCSSAVVDYATRGIKCNTSRYDKSMNAFKTGGDVKIAVSEKEDLMSLSIMALNHIKYWLANGEEASNIAVLARNNFHLALLNSMLFRNGIYCNITKEMKLTKSFIFRDMEILIDFCDDCWDPDHTSTILWKLCRYMKATAARLISNLQNTAGLSIKQTIGFVVKDIMREDVDFGDKINVSAQVTEKVRYALSYVKAETANDLIALYKALCNNDKYERFKILLNLYYENTREYLNKTKDKQRSVVGLSAYLLQLMKSDGFDGLKEFIKYSKQYENGNSISFGDEITLTTEHSAKGREWKNVIMFACDNVSQPSLDGIKCLINDGVSDEDVYASINEERRLCYVGNTRAKENLLIITYKMPSMFILEALGIIKGDFNKEILSVACKDHWADIYKPDIDKLILSKDSQYYYNAEDYKV